MRCADIVKRLYDEKGWEINKSQLIHYDTMMVVNPKRDSLFRRVYSESNYFDLKWAISLSKSGVTIPAIREILALNRDIMELTAEALREKSKSVWVTAAELAERVKQVKRV